MAPAASKVYDEAVVVALLMALKAKGGTLAEPYKDMVKLDGSRTNSSFEHSLRNVNKLAGTLNDKKAKGEILTPADIGNNTTGDAPTTPAKATPKKRGGKFHQHSEFLHIVAEKLIMSCVPQLPVTLALPHPSALGSRQLNPG